MFTAKFPIHIATEMKHTHIQKVAFVTIYRNSKPNCNQIFATDEKVGEAKLTLFVWLASLLTCFTSLRQPLCPRISLLFVCSGYFLQVLVAANEFSAICIISFTRYCAVLPELTSDSSALVKLLICVLPHKTKNPCTSWAFFKKKTKLLSCTWATFERERGLNKMRREIRIGRPLRLYKINRPVYAKLQLCPQTDKGHLAKLHFFPVPGVKVDTLPGETLKRTTVSLSFCLFFFFTI